MGIIIPQAPDRYLEVEDHPHREPFYFAGATKRSIKRQAEAIVAYKKRYPKLRHKDYRNGRDEVEAKRIGLMGEAALAEYLGVTYDQKPRQLGDKRGDIVAYGQRIEVKTSRGALIFNNARHLGAGLAVLVKWYPKEWGRVDFQGWLTRELFLDHYFTHDFGYGERLCMAPANLYPIATLPDYLRTVAGEVDYEA